MPKEMETRGEIIRRVIALIDMMATWRQSHGTVEIVDRLNEKLGASFNNRTVYRDLVALHEQGLVERERKPKTKGFFWKLKLRKSESCQRAGIEIY
jgi:repressor of nif and glnA expression